MRSLSTRTALVADATAERFAVTVGQLLDGGTAPIYSRPRHVLCWAMISLGWGYAETGRELGMHHTSIMHAVRVVSAHPELVAAAFDVLATVTRDLPEAA